MNMLNDLSSHSPNNISYYNFRNDNLLSVITLLSGVILLFYLFIFPRCVAYIICFIANKFYFHKTDKHLKFSSIKFSPLSGRLTLSEFSWITNSYNISCTQILVRVDWWKFIKKSSSRNNLHSFSPVLVCIQNLRYHLYYREILYTRLDKLFSKHFAFDNDKDKQDEVVNQPMSIWMKFALGAKFTINKGILLFGNSTVPYTLAFRFSRASGYYRYDHGTTVEDLYKTVAYCKASNLSILLLNSSGKIEKRKSKCSWADNSRYILNTKKFIIEYTTDVPGLANDMTLPPPIYLCDVWVAKGSTINYSPWTNNQRILLQRLFFPWEYTETFPDPLPKVGTIRKFENFNVGFHILENTPNSTSYITLNIIFNDIKSESQTSVITIKADYGSSVNICFPWRITQTGYTPKISGKIINGRVTLPFFPLSELASAQVLNFDISMQYPLKWNDLQTWIYTLTGDYVKINFVFLHLDLFDALLEDWNNMPNNPPDISSHQPLQWNIEASITNFEVITFINQYNWIVNNGLGNENNRLAFCGRLGKIFVNIPFLNFHPMKQSISFTAQGEDVVGRLFLPHTSGIRNSIINLYEVNSYRWFDHSSNVDSTTDDMVSCMELSMGYRNNTKYPNEWIDVGFGPYLTIECIFSYTPQTHPDQPPPLSPNNLQIFVEISDLVARMFGSLLLVLLNLKDNYPGEYQDLHPMTNGLENTFYGQKEKLKGINLNPLEVELVFNLKQALIELPIFPNSWEDDCPFLPRLYCDLVEITFSRTLDEATIRVFTDPLTIIAGSPKQANMDLIDIGLGICEGIVFYGHSLSGYAYNDWQEYAWLVDVKLGVINGSASLPQFLQITSWLLTVVDHVLAKEDSNCYPLHMKISGSNSAQSDLPPGHMLKYMFININFKQMNITIFDKFQYTIIIDIPNLDINFCNLFSCVMSHGISILLNRFNISVLAPIFERSLWNEVGCLNSGRIIIQIALNSLKIPIDHNEVQQKYLIEADKHKHLWFLYTTKARYSLEGKRMCGCKGGCYFAGTSPVSENIDWLPHMKVKRETKRVHIMDYFQFLLTSKLNDFCSFSNLNSLLQHLMKQFKSHGCKIQSDYMDDSASSLMERFLSLGMSSENEFSDAVSYQSAFSSLEENPQICIDEDILMQDGILSQYHLKVHTFSFNLVYLFHHMLSEIRKEDSNFFSDADISLYSTQLCTETVKAYVEQYHDIPFCEFSLPEFTIISQSRVPKNAHLDTTTSIDCYPNLSSDSLRIDTRMQIEISDDLEINCTTNIIATIASVLESLQDVFTTPHPLSILNSAKFECVDGESTRAEIISYQGNIPNSSTFLSVFLHPKISISFCFIRSSPITHKIRSLINSPATEFHFFSYINISIENLFIDIQNENEKIKKSNNISTSFDDNLLISVKNKVAFHASIQHFHFQAGLFFTNNPLCPIDRVIQSFEHIPLTQSKARIRFTDTENKFSYISQLEAGADIAVTACTTINNILHTVLINNDICPRKLSIASLNSFWSYLSSNQEINCSFDISSKSLWFHLPCARNTANMHRDIAPSWIICLILYTDGVINGILPITKAIRKVMEFRKNWIRDVFISLCSQFIANGYDEIAYSSIHSAQSKCLHRSLPLIFINNIQSIFNKKGALSTLQIIPNDLSLHYKQTILDSIIAKMITIKISHSKDIIDSHHLNAIMNECFIYSQTRSKFISLFNGFDLVYKYLDYDPNMYKSESISLNISCSFPEFLVWISQNETKASLTSRLHAHSQSTRLISIEHLIISLKIANNAANNAVPRYQCIPQTIGHISKPILNVKTIIHFPNISFCFQIDDIIVIYSSILGLQTHLLSQFKSHSRPKRNSASNSQKKMKSGLIRQNLQSRFWHEWTENWIEVSKMLNNAQACNTNILRSRKISTFFANQLPQTPTKYMVLMEQNSDLIVDSNKSLFCNSQNNISNCNENSTTDIFIVIRIDNIIIFCSDEININLSLRDISSSLYINGNCMPSSKQEEFSHSGITRLSTLITLAIIEGNLLMTDADNHADILTAVLSPINGMAFFKIEDKLLMGSLLYSMDYVDYLCMLNLTDLNINVLRPPDLLFESISNFILKIVRDISIIVSSYYSIDSRNNLKADRISSSVFFDSSLPFNLPTGSIVFYFSSAVLNIDALESISLQYEFSGFEIFMNSAPQRLRLAILLDKHVILSLSKITGGPLDTLNIPRVNSIFEVKSLKPIVFAPELSIESVDLNFSIDLINQIIALSVAYTFEIHKMIYDLRPYLPRPVYVSSTHIEINENNCNHSTTTKQDTIIDEVKDETDIFSQSAHVRESAFSIFDMLHSVKFHLDPINIHLSSMSGIAMNLKTSTLDIIIQNRNFLINRTNIHYLQAGRFILLDKISFDINLSLVMQHSSKTIASELAYFKTNIQAEDSLQDMSDVPDNLETLSVTKHLFLLTIFRPHMFIPTFAMENIISYIIHWHGGYLFWQKQVHYNEYIGETKLSTPSVISQSDQIGSNKQYPAIFDFFSLTLFQIAIYDLGICIPISHQVNVSSTISMHTLNATVSSLTISASLGKKCAGLGTFKDFVIGFRHHFNPNDLEWGPADISNKRCVNSGTVEKGSCQFAMAYSLDEVPGRGKRDRVEVQVIFFMAGIECYMDSNIAFYISTLFKSIANLASGIEAVQESSQTPSGHSFTDFEKRNSLLKINRQSYGSLTINDSKSNSKLKSVTRERSSSQLMADTKFTNQHFTKNTYSKLSWTKLHKHAEPFEVNSTNEDKPSIWHSNIENVQIRSDNYVSSIVSDRVASPSCISIISVDKDKIAESLDIKQIPPKEEIVDYLHGIDIDINVSIKVEHGTLLIDSHKKSESDDKLLNSWKNRITARPGSSNASSDDGSSLDLNISHQPIFSESSNLYIPGFDISLCYTSTILNEIMEVNSLPILSSPKQHHRAKLHLIVLIHSVPREMRILPALLDFLDSLAQPVSKFAQTTSNIIGTSGLTDAPMATYSPIPQINDYYPIDINFYICLKPSVIRISCLPISRVEAVLHVPHVETMCNLTLFIQNDPVYKASYGFRLLRSYLDPKYSLNLYLVSNMNLTTYLSKFSLSITSFFSTKQDEIDIMNSRDSLRLQLDAAKLNLFRKSIIYTHIKLDNDQYIHVSTTDLSIVADIGKLIFKFDMRRFTDVTTFRKCWHKKSLLDLIFIGLASVPKTNPSQDPKPTKLKDESAASIIFSFQINECLILCNLAEIMGDCNLNVKSLGFRGKFGHCAGKFLLLSVKIFLDNCSCFALGGIIAGNMRLENSAILISLSDSHLHKLPSHQFSFDMKSFEGKLKYMGLSVVLIEAKNIKLRGYDMWEESSGSLILKLMLNIEWNSFRMMLTQSTPDSVMSIMYRLEEFIQEQKKRSRKILATILPNDQPQAIASLIARIDDTKPLNPPIKRLFTIGWFWATKNSILNLIGNLGFKLSSPAGLHLGGDVNIIGQGLAIAFSSGPTFQTDSWVIISLKDLEVFFSTDAIPGLALSNMNNYPSSRCRICRHHFRIDLLRQPNEEEHKEKVAVYKVSRKKGFHISIESNIVEWLDYICIEHKLRINKNFCPHLNKIVKTSEDLILSFPSLYIDLASDHICTGEITDTNQDIVVECRFDSEFYSGVEVTTNIDSYVFLHDLFKGYLERLSQLATKDFSNKNSSAINLIPPKSVDNTSIDLRKFVCISWHMDPALYVRSVVSWGSGTVNNIDWLLDKLSLRKARTTIPKCIQRGAMDPIDHLISLFLKLLLNYVAEKKSV